MGMAAYTACRALAGLVPAGTWGEIMLVLGAALAGGAVFVALALILRIRELIWLLGLLKARLLR